MNYPNNDRRHFHRILFDAPVEIETESDTYHTNLLDISLKGVLAKRPLNWQPQIGEQATLRVVLNDMECVITMQVSCTHIQAEQLGLLCEEIDMESISLLRRLVELNIGNESLLQRDLEALG
jgi:hypothetical protein